jgi:hypothetical protein
MITHSFNWSLRKWDINGHIDQGKVFFILEVKNEAGCVVRFRGKLVDESLAEPATLDCLASFILC